MYPVVIFDFDLKKQPTKLENRKWFCHGRHFQKQILSEFSGEGAFEGEVSLANNGGFCAVKYVLEPIELITHFSIRIKGDGTTYQFRVKSNKKWFPFLCFSLQDGY
jgi:hypothetical protein